MKSINNLSLSKEMINKLKEKELGFAYDEIKEIVISLQLIGLDLNKKKY